MTNDQLADEVVASVLDWTPEPDAVVRNLLYMLREPHSTRVTDRTRTWYTQLAPLGA